MSETDILTDESGAPDQAASATALAEPPQPPVVPPGANATGEAPRPRPNRSGIVAASISALLALALLGVVAYLVVGQVRAVHSTTATSANQTSAFDSALKKAGVNGSAPAVPTDVTLVAATGSHHFTATFTPQEISALMNAFPYTAEIAGVQMTVGSVRISFPQPGSARVNGVVSANGGQYGGSVTLPVTFADGHISTGPVEELSASGLPSSGAQKALARDYLTTYLNAYLSAAPGLKIESAAITPSGLAVTGTAPNGIAVTP